MCIKIEKFFFLVSQKEDEKKLFFKCYLYEKMKSY